jgi:glycosyltransferase involved in cell wall biosynthesis
MVSGYANYLGGVENVVIELDNFLVNQGVDVTVFTESKRDFIKNRPGIKSVEVRPYYLPKFLQVAYYDKIAYSLKTWRKTKGMGPFDIIHGHADNCLFTSLFRNETPFVMTFHGTRARVLPRRDPRAIPDFLAEKTAASKCDAAVACSTAVKNEISSFYGVKARKIVVIHNGVDIVRFAPRDKVLARRQLGLPVNHKYALWVGRDPVRKGLLTAIKAVEAFSNVHLIIVGLEGKSSEKTVFLGKASESQLINAYNAADFLLFPTLYEGFPVAPLEALASGLPMIVSEESNMGEIIREGVQGYIVKDGSPQIYKEKIELILRDQFAIEKMSFECRKLGLQYSWEKQAQKYLKLYQRLLM